MHGNTTLRGLQLRTADVTPEFLFLDRSTYQPDSSRGKAMGLEYGDRP